MELVVLGSLAVTHAGNSAQLPGELQRRLLAALVVNANTLVPADRLTHVLWGDPSAPTATRKLHNLVWRMRSAFDRCGAGGAALVTEPPGYLLRVTPEAIDAVRFERAIGEAIAERVARPERAVARLTEALGLWHGPAYAEFADEEFCRYEAMRLEELRLVALEERFEANIALGRHAELIGEIEAFAAEHPFRERPRDLLMVALCRSGRQADAVNVYAQFRRHVVDQLGLEPSATLRRRHEHILHGDPGLEPDPRRERRGASDRIGNLRQELSELVGRGEDVARALTTLARARVVTMTGVGGVGKTRLATRVATETQGEFPDGVWVCELAAVRDGWLVPDVLATTLGAPEPLGSRVTDGLVDFLRSRRTLLVIDNCEHVLDAVAHLVDALARSCPKVTVLATSREPLGVDGEHVLPVRPLAVPPVEPPGDLATVATAPSVALFVDRARAAMPNFALGPHNAASVAEICRGLDGLPLAIELAATRLRSMSLDEIARLLERRLDFLHSAKRVREERHSTLGAVVDWSYDLLTARERAVFAELSALVGSFTLRDAVAVASDGTLDATDVVDGVTGLVHKSMLAADTDRVQTRYTMLETLRIYGRAQLARTGRLAANHERHAAYCTAVAEASSVGLLGPDEAQWAERIAWLLDDLRVAHSWALTAEPAVAVRISAALLRYTSAHGPSEVYSWADRAVAVAEVGGGADPRLAAALSVAAAGAARRSDLAGALALVKRGLAAVPDHADPERRFPLWILARVASFQGRLAAAAGLYATVADLAKRAGDAQCVAYVTASAALQHVYQGTAATGLALARRARKLALATENPTAIAWADYVLGVTLHDSDPERALSRLENARAVGQACGNTYIPGVAQSVAAAVMTRHGDPHQAARLVARVIGYWSQEGHWAQQWVALRTAIRLLTRLGEDEAAVTLHGALESSRAAMRPVGAEAEAHDAVVAAAADRLGRDRFAAASAHGATLSDDDVVAFAGSALEWVGWTGSAEHLRAVTASGEPDHGA
jgi:predicted ATPase/DNA-binding SARP family transcriptional activator